MSLERFPWQRCAPGESFFVPCLDVRETLRQGLAEGHMLYGAHAALRGRIGVYAGRLGVLFTVKQQKQRPNTSG